MPTLVVSRQSLQDAARTAQTVLDLVAEADRLDDRVRRLELILSILLTNPAIQALDPALSLHMLALAQPRPSDPPLPPKGVVGGDAPLTTDAPVR